MPEIRKWKSDRELLLADEFGGRVSASSTEVVDDAVSVAIAPGADDQIVVIGKVAAKATYSGTGLLTIEADGALIWEQDLAASDAEKEFDFGAIGLAGGPGETVTVRATAGTSMTSGRLWVLGQRK